MPNKPDERLIILLPPDLLEEVRRAAEEADLSVSQIVRRALRNELKAIAQKDTVSDTNATLLQNLGRLFLEAQRSGLLNGSAFYGDPVPGAPTGNTIGDDSISKVAEIHQNKPRGRK
jgi:Ribbon-helix-helix protein, copG family